MDSFGIEGYFFACESNFDRSRLHLSRFLLDFSSNFTNTQSPYAMEEINSGKKMEGNFGHAWNWTDESRGKRRKTEEEKLGRRTLGRLSGCW